MPNFSGIGYRVPSELTESTFRGSVLSIVALIAMGSVLVMETKAYFSSSIGANLALHRSIDDTRVQLNFNITMMDLPCDYAAVDVFSTIGHQKDIVKNIKKFPIDADGVLQQYEQQPWHNNDVELWDPAVWESLEKLHEDGEDAIRLNSKSFQYALDHFPLVFVYFFSNECPTCNDLNPTFEALGEIITDTAMSLVDDLQEVEYSEDEYEKKVNEMAPVLITKLNCSDFPNVCNEQKVKVYPSLFLYHHGVAKSAYQGHRTVMEMVHWLTKMERSLQPNEPRMHAVVEFANERVVRSEEEEIWNDEVSDRRAPTNTTMHPGCQISGNLFVDEAPGKFIIHSNSYGHSIAPHMTNVSHIVNHFSFGDLEDQKYVIDSWLNSPVPQLQKSLYPLDGHTYALEELHQAYHHHLQVVTTEIKQKHSNIARVYRMRAASHLAYSRHFTVPEAKFTYDLSPIAISYMTISRSWYEYLTSIIAIIGGTFAVLGLMDTGLSSFGKRSTSYYLP